MTRTFIFSDIELSAFSLLSGDVNPLHLDQKYARKTPFGQRVVYGALVAMRLIVDYWPNIEKYELAKMSVYFYKPVFLDLPYICELVAKDQQLILKLTLNGVLKCRIVFDGLVNKVVHIKSPLPKNMFKNVNSVSRLSTKAVVEGMERDLNQQVVKMSYCANFEHSSWLQIPWISKSQEVPTQILNVLAWASFFVGMETPGQQALFSSFQVDFGGDRFFESKKIDVKNFLVNKDERFNLTTISAAVSSCALIKIEAFARPINIGYEFPDPQLLNFPKFDNKACLVVGGSRGFGLAVGVGFALSGAKTKILTRSIDDDFSQVLNEAEKRKIALSAVIGEASCGNEIKSLGQDMIDQGLSLDYVILNAIGPIHDSSFRELGPSGVMKFIDKNAVLFLHPLYEILEIFKSGVTFVFISTAFLNEDSKNFSHYCGLKSFGESILKCLSAEYPCHAFVALRLPKMLTDQTNVISIGQQQLPSVNTIAMASIEKIASIGQLKGFHVIDIKPGESFVF